MRQKTGLSYKPQAHCSRQHNQFGHTVPKIELRTHRNNARCSAWSRSAWTWPVLCTLHVCCNEYSANAGSVVARYVAQLSKTPRLDGNGAARRPPGGRNNSVSIVANLTAPAQVAGNQQSLIFSLDHSLGVAVLDSTDRAHSEISCATLSACPRDPSGAFSPANSATYATVVKRYRLSISCSPERAALDGARDKVSLVW